MINPGSFVPTRRREYISADFTDRSAFDENGLVKDGYRLRVPIEMMDAALPIAPTSR
jgi:hypothetical protein